MLSPNSDGKCPVFEGRAIVGEKRCFLRFPAPITTYKISTFYLKMVDLAVVIGTGIHRFSTTMRPPETGNPLWNLKTTKSHLPVMLPHGRPDKRL